MNDTQIKKEFTRWINAGRPKVWCRYSHEKHWSIKNIPIWNETEMYIVDDHQAEFRKLQIDKPDTKFQIWGELEEDWWDCRFPTWNPDYKYRVKPKEWYEDPEMVGRPVWARDSLRKAELSEVFKRYDKDSQFPFVTTSGSFKYARPIKPEECYQGVNDELTK